ncbi:MAG: hypothetical protein IJS53_03275, partial [Clostridia bacterium]|nr:hypothetical protein [Clostridia bacterium]
LYLLALAPVVFSLYAGSRGWVYELQKPVLFLALLIALTAFLLLALVWKEPYKGAWMFPLILPLLLGLFVYGRMLNGGAFAALIVEIALYAAIVALYVFKSFEAKWKKAVLGIACAGLCLLTLFVGLLGRDAARAQTLELASPQGKYTATVKWDELFLDNGFSVTINRNDNEILKTLMGQIVESPVASLYESAMNRRLGDVTACWVDEGSFWFEDQLLTVE